MSTHGDSAATGRPLALLELLEALEQYDRGDGNNGLCLQRWVNGSGDDDADAAMLVRELIVNELRGYTPEVIGELVLARLGGAS